MRTVRVLLTQRLVGGAARGLSITRCAEARILAKTRVAPVPGPDVTYAFYISHCLV